MTQQLDALPFAIQSTLIRRLRASDLTIFQEYRADAELARYQAWSVMSEREALDFIANYVAVNAFEPGGWIQLAIADRATDVLLGDLGLFVDELQHEAELGFTLKRAAQGAGHATRAVRGAVDILFKHTPVSSIRAVTDVRNTGSIGVLERVGFRRCHQQHAVFKGEACLEYVYVLVKNDNSTCAGLEFLP